MKRKSNAFSLIELVAVLAILAAAATIAIRATSNLQTQARYQQTTRSLNDIQASIVGPSNQRSADGTALVTGFVADTGRLPQFSISSSDPLGTAGDPLNELISLPATLQPYQIWTSNVDPTVSVGSGWQGPYIHLGAGPTFIRDGWGNSYHVYSYNSGSSPQWSPITTAGTAISAITSWAADNAPDVNHLGSTSIEGNYNDDVSIPGPYLIQNTPSTGLVGIPFSSSASITGQITMNVGTDTVSGNPLATGPTPTNLTFTGIPSFPISPTPTAVSSAPVSIWVAYFGPDPTQSPNPVATDAVLVDYNTSITPGTPNAGTWNSAWTGQFLISANSSPSFTNVTIGPRVLKVYVLPQAVQTTSQFKAYVSIATNPIYTSSTLNVTLVSGTQTINLVLPHYSP